MSDNDLRNRFEALRDEEAERAPSFDRVVGRDISEAPPRHRRGGLLAAAAAAAVVAVFLFNSLGPDDELEPTELDSGMPYAWRMPTDVLLDLPGDEFLRDVPAMGTAPGSGYEEPEVLERSDT